MQGYRWFIKDMMGEYEPNEETFATLKECVEDSKDYEEKFVGIDFVEDNDGMITQLKRIKNVKDIYSESEE